MVLLAMAGEKKQLIPIKALAASIDKRTRAAAKSMDRSRKFYYLYCVLDPLAATYSSFRLGVSWFHGTNSPDLVHELMLTPAGIAGIVLESLFLVSISVIATVFDKNKNNPVFIQHIVDRAPDVREWMKGIKNPFKGWQSASLAINVVGGELASELIIGLGFSFGLLGSVNRVLLFQMRNRRKKMMANNTDLMKEIFNLETLTSEKMKELKGTIQDQTRNTQIAAFVGMTLNGFFDGLYLYVGVLGLAVVSPQLMVPLLIISAFFTLTCLIARNYEEFDYQLDLTITITQAKLLLLSKRLETLHTEYCLKKMGTRHESPEQLDQMKNDILKLLAKYETKRFLLIKQSTKTWSTAALSGLKNALAAYSAVNSIVFTLSAILLLASTPIPQALLLITVLIGLSLIVGFVAHALYEHYQEVNTEKPEDPFHANLNTMRANLEAGNTEYEFFNTSLARDIPIITSTPPKSNVPKWFEILRATCAGAGKGRNFPGFAGNSAQELNAQGHFQDTPVMAGISVLTAGFWAWAMGARGVAREFGRDSLSKVNLEKSVDKTSSVEMYTLSHPPPDQPFGAYIEEPHLKNVNPQNPAPLFIDSEEEKEPYPDRHVSEASPKNSLLTDARLSSLQNKIEMTAVKKTNSNSLFTKNARPTRNPEIDSKSASLSPNPSYATGGDFRLFPDTKRNSIDLNTLDVQCLKSTPQGCNITQDLM